MGLWNLQEYSVQCALAPECLVLSSVNQAYILISHGDAVRYKSKDRAPQRHSYVRRGELTWYSSRHPLLVRTRQILS